MERSNYLDPISVGVCMGLVLIAVMVGVNVSGYTKRIFYNNYIVASGTIGLLIGP